MILCGSTNHNTIVYELHELSGQGDITPIELFGKEGVFIREVEGIWHSFI